MMETIPKNKKIIKLNWKEFDELISKLANKVKEFNFEYIFGIPKGGLIPAVVLCHILNKKLLVEFGGLYDDLLNHEVLIVDDICDSGKTMRKYSTLAKYTATLHYVKSSIFTPDFWVAEKDKDSWIVYPWEQT